MFKPLVLCFAILTLICAIQCTPTPVRRDKYSPMPKRDDPSPMPKRHRPSPMPDRRDALVTRGLCDFLCPQENLVGTGLSRMSTDSGRLYCRYGVERADDNAFCMYKRNTGDLLPGFSPFECDHQAAFYCPSMKNGQEDARLSPSHPKDSRSVNLPEFVKARSKARRTVGGG